MREHLQIHVQAQQRADRRLILRHRHLLHGTIAIRLINEALLINEVRPRQPIGVPHLETAVHILRVEAAVAALLQAEAVLPTLPQAAAVRVLLHRHTAAALLPVRAEVRDRTAAEAAVAEVAEAVAEAAVAAEVAAVEVVEAAVADADK